VTAAPPNRAWTAVFSGYATSSLKNMMSGLRGFTRFGREWTKRHGGTWADPDTLLRYIDHRLDPNPEWPSYNKVIHAQTAAAYLSCIPAWLRMLNIKFPAVPKVEMMRKSFFRERPDEHVQHRRAIEWDELLSVLDALRASHGATGSSSIAVLAFHCMLRATEATSLRSHKTQLRGRPGGSDTTAITSSFKDKTHVDQQRTITLVQHPAWQMEFAFLHNRVAALHTLQDPASTEKGLALFEKSELDRVRAALAGLPDGTSMGSFRPGGLMHHLQSGTKLPIIIKMGGWSTASYTYIQSYTRMEHSGTASLLSRSQAHRVARIADQIDHSTSATEPTPYLQEETEMVQWDARHTTEEALRISEQWL